MKKILWIVYVLLHSGYTYAQNQKTLPPDVVTMAKAYYLLDKNTPKYNPVEALELYKEVAAQGNGKAMNAIGNIYAFGLCGAVDNAEALSWYQKATAAGYDPSWYNLATMYKYGYGTTQSFETAYQAFESGVAANQGSCYYGKGYMLFKGLGVAQNYEEAIIAFRQSIKRNNLGGMYMLGLCFRNGYGIAANIDSARYWLSKAATAGYQFAKDEMQDATAERNPAIANKNTNANTPPAPSEYENVIQNNTEAQQLAGTYSGLVIKYDWSGKHILQQSKITLTLYGAGKEKTGMYTEDDSLSIPVTATLTDSNLVFKQTSYQKTDHYSRGKLMEFEFKEACLQVNNLEGQVYINGNLQLWSKERQEPDKKLYLSLQEVNSPPQQMATQQQNKLDPTLANDELHLHRLAAYPNPFQNEVNLSFYLEEDAKVTISIVNMQGIKVQQHKGLNFSAGKNQYSISTQLPAGTYVLQLQHGNKTEQTVLIKN